MKAMSILMRVCAWLIILLLPSKAMAQEMRVPDNDDILLRTIDAESPYYLDKLLAKYLSR